MRPPIGPASGSMSANRTIARNVVWNWAGMATPMLAGFVIAPFLVHRLGELRYGEWILISSMTNYFGLLDLGIRQLERFDEVSWGYGKQQQQISFTIWFWQP